jgi:hypothetical protein
MNNLHRYIVLLGILTLVTASDLVAQKTQKKTTRIALEYIKNYDKTESLVATLRVKDPKYIALNDVVVQFYSVYDTSKILLDKIRTNENGEAIFLLDDNPKILKDTSGVMSFEVEYFGDKSKNSSKRKLSVKQANLEMSFLQKADVKSIEVSANEIGLDGEPIPIEGITLQFYIKGTFSLLNFAKEKTDEDGIVQVEFPVDMPGDTAGVLTIVVKIEENRTFGTIESRGKMNWAIQLEPTKEKQRGLGDTDAPLWMVYTLIILLSAVWFHYFYVIFLIIKIKLANRGY